MKKREKEVVPENNYKVVVVVLLIAGLFAFLLFATGPNGRSREVPSSQASQPGIADTPTGAVIGDDCKEWTRFDSSYLNYAGRDYGNSYDYDVVTIPSATPIYSQDGSLLGYPLYLVGVHKSVIYSRDSNVWVRQMYSEGSRGWAQSYDNVDDNGLGVNENDEGRGIAYDGANLYITGYVRHKVINITTGRVTYRDDTFVQKRRPDTGEIIWSSFSKLGDANQGNAIAADAIRNVGGMLQNPNKMLYVAGFKGTHNISYTRSKDIYLFALSSPEMSNDTQVRWSKTYDGSAHQEDEAKDIALVPPTVSYGKMKTNNNGDSVIGVAVGYVTVTPILQSGKVNKDAWMQAFYLINGTPLWTVTQSSSYDVSVGILYDNESANGVVIDRLGGIYITGNVVAQETKYKNGSIKTPRNKDLWVAKMLLGGGFVWHRTIDVNNVNGNDEGFSVAVDNDTNIYVTGGSENKTLLSDDVDAFTIKFDANGRELKRWKHSSNVTITKMVGNGVALDVDKKVYVAGRKSNRGDYEEIWMQKYCNK